MIQKEWDMQSLSDALLQPVRRYGIKEVSMGQYEAVCKKIVHFSSEHGFSTCYPGLKTDFNAFIDAKVNDKSICYEYGRLQHRVIRMMVSLAETGETDFSGCFNPPGKYAVSGQSKELIEKVLDYHSLRSESRTEMSIVMRHFFKYAENKTGIDKVDVTDGFLMDFFTKELPKTNKGSMGRSLRRCHTTKTKLSDHSAMTLLPYIDGTFSCCQSASAQETRSGIGQQIQAGIIFSSFVESLETIKKAQSFIKIIESCILSGFKKVQKL